FASFEVVWDAVDTEEAAFLAKVELVARMTARAVAPVLRPTPEQNPTLADVLDDVRDGAPDEQLFVLDQEQALVLARPPLAGGERPALLPGPVLQADKPVVGPVQTTVQGRMVRVACAPIQDELGETLGVAGVVEPAIYLEKRGALQSRTRDLVLVAASLVGL